MCPRPSPSVQNVREVLVHYLRYPVVFLWCDQSFIEDGVVEVVVSEVEFHVKKMLLPGHPCLRADEVVPRREQSWIWFGYYPEPEMSSSTVRKRVGSGEVEEALGVRRICFDLSIVYGMVFTVPAVFQLWMDAVFAREVKPVGWLEVLRIKGGYSRDLRL